MTILITLCGVMTKLFKNAQLSGGKDGEIDDTY